MYKCYDKNGKKVMHHEFHSLSEYIDYLSHAKKNPTFTGTASETGTLEFTDTNSFDETIKLAKYGYHENFDKMMELKMKLDKYLKLSNNRSKQYNYYVGYAPDVKSYLEGSPLSMLNRNRVARRKIDLYVQCACASITSKESVYNRGIIILSLIQVLETLGYNVDLHLFSLSSDCYYSAYLYCDFLLKKENERVNPQKLYFPLCHPSWLRRLEFKLTECTPDITNDWASGYGYPCDMYEIRRFLNLKENDIVIPESRLLGVEGYDLIDDINSVFSFINRSDTPEDLILDKVERVRKI